jgi:hypothetical protein
MHSKNYNLIPLSIDQGLNRVPIGTAGGYIRLLEAPAAANVQIHLNEQNADGIPLKTYHAIEATNIEKIFVSCNAVPGEKITVVQANTAKDFKMVTPASDVKLSSLGSYESVALDQLDKIINPYNLLTKYSGDYVQTSETTVLSKTLQCDKLKIILSGYWNGYGFNDGGVTVKINGNRVLASGGYGDSNGGRNNGRVDTEIKVTRGDTLDIDIFSRDADHHGIFYIEEYTLK